MMPLLRRARQAISVPRSEPEETGEPEEAAEPTDLRLSGAALDQLQSIDLTVPANTLVAIVATKDETKQALLDALSGNRRLRSGTMELDGRPLTLGDKRVSQVGANPQHQTLQQAFTGDRTDVDRADIQSTVRMLGLEDIMDRADTGLQTQVARFSSSDRRRLELAAALTNNPDLLLLDEPTDGLGASDERRMIRALAAAAHGRSTIVFTRRLPVARQADEVYVLDGPRLVPYQGYGSGNHSDLWETREPPVQPTDSNTAATGTATTATAATLRPAPTHQRVPAPVSRSDWGTSSIGDYTVTALLGRSTLTETWKAVHRDTGATVRIKLPRKTASGQPSADYGSWEQLNREFQILSELQHPGLVRAIEADLEAETPYAVFEYLPGESLAERGARNPKGLAPIDVLFAGYVLAEVLGYLHRRNHVHLNLRTGHVRIRGGSMVLADLTQCRQAGSRLPSPTGSASPSPSPTHASGLLSTFAPELKPGRSAQPSMDVYALGILLRRLATGPAAVQAIERNGRPTPLRNLAPDWPKDAAELVDAMLALNPHDRPDCTEVMVALRKATAAAQPERSTHNAPPPRAPQLRLVAAASG